MPFPPTWTVRLEGTYLIGNDGSGHSFRFDLNTVLDYDNTTGSFKWGSSGFASKARRNSIELQPGTSRLSAVFGSERVFVDLSTHLRLDRNGALVYSYAESTSSQHTTQRQSSYFQSSDSTSSTQSSGTNSSATSRNTSSSGSQSSRSTSATSVSSSSSMALDLDMAALMASFAEARWMKVKVVTQPSQNDFLSFLETFFRYAEEIRKSREVKEKVDKLKKQEIENVKTDVFNIEDIKKSVTHKVTQNVKKEIETSVKNAINDAIHAITAEVAKVVDNTNELIITEMKKEIETKYEQSVSKAMENVTTKSMMSYHETIKEVMKSKVAGGLAAAETDGALLHQILASTGAAGA